MPERHGSKEHQEERQYQERVPKDVSLDVKASPKRTTRSPARESGDITDLVNRVPGEALVPEVPPVEQALRRA